MKLLPSVVLLIFISNIILISSCSKDKQAEPLSLKSNKITINLAAGSGKDSVLITSNTNWAISGIPAWLNITPSSSTGNSKVLFEIQPNTGLHARSAHLALKGNGVDSSVITVTQLGSDPFITSDSTTLNIPSGAGTDSLVITANIPWTLTIPPQAESWISASKLTDTAGNSKVNFSFSPNNTPAPRTAILNFTGQGATTPSHSVTINQDQPNVVINYFTYMAGGGESIIITGTGYSPIASQNKVWINAIPATVTQATATMLTVTVPSKAGSGPLKVTVNTRSATTQYDFVYRWIGAVTVFAGGTKGYLDGMGTNAQFTHPTGIDFDAAGNLYVADYANEKVRKITPTGQVSTAPGRLPPWNHPTWPNTDYKNPSDVAVDAAGNIYVSEVLSGAISRITNSGQVELVAGGVNMGFQDGTGTAAQFYYPAGLDIDANGNIIVADYANNRIRMVTPAGVVTTVAGSVFDFADGTGANAWFKGPYGITVDRDGNYLVTDDSNNRVRKVTPAGVVTTYAGPGQWGTRDGPREEANIRYPLVIVEDSLGNIYFTDDNNELRWITLAGEVITIDTKDQFSKVNGIAISPSGEIYVSDYYNNRICKVTIQ